MDDYVLKLADQCDSRSDWISLINYGIEFLKKRPTFLLQLIVLRAGKENAAQVRPQNIAVDVVSLFQALNLTVSVDPRLDRGAD